MRATSICVACALLAGCGAPDPASTNEAARADAGNAVTVATVAAAPPAATAQPSPAIPARFRGRWALVPDDCDPARGDAKGLMIVAADGLRFYEARASVRAVAGEGDRTRLTLDFTGEGQAWAAETDLALAEDGRALTRNDRDPPSSLRYRRCAA